MTTTKDDDLATRQYEAQMRILHVLRDLNLVEVNDIGPVVAGLAASMLMRVPPEHREYAAGALQQSIEWWLQQSPEGILPDHDA